MSERNENPEGIAKFAAGMPPLDHLHGSLRSKRELGKIVGIHQTPSGDGRQIVDAFVTYVDRSLRDYRDTRTAMLSFLSEGFSDDFYLAIDRWDSCVNSVHKAVCLIVRLRSKGYRCHDGSPLVPRPRDLTVLQDSSRNAIRRFRDAAEHLDEDILEGRVPSTRRVGVHLSWTEASISGNTLSYADVHSWICQLHSIAEPLSVVRLQLVPKP